MGQMRGILPALVAAIGGCGEGQGAGHNDPIGVSYGPEVQRATWVDHTVHRVAPEVHLAGCATSRFVDLDGDGHVEMLVPTMSGAVLVHPVRDGRIQPRSAVVGDPGESGTRNWFSHGCLLHVQDLDGDGQLDLVTRGGPAALRVRWMRGMTVREERVHVLPATQRAEEVIDVALWVNGPRRWLLAAVSPDESDHHEAPHLDFTLSPDGTRAEARGYTPQGHLSAIALDGPGALRDVPIAGDTRCLGGGITPLGSQALVACDFSAQRRVRADAQGALRAEEIPGSYGHGMGISPVELPDGRRVFVVSSLGGWMVIPEDLSAARVLGAVPAVPWEMSPVDLNHDGVVDLVTQGNGVLDDPRATSPALLRRLFLEGDIPITAAWGLLSERVGDRVRYRPLRTEMARPTRVMGRKHSVVDLDGDGALEQVFSRAQADGAARRGELVVGHTVVPGDTGESRSVYVPPQPVPTRWRVSCPDGRERAWWVYPALGLGGNNQTWYTYQCAADGRSAVATTFVLDHRPQRALAPSVVALRTCAQPSPS
ncbi:MAG: VCBS repeat-containing protein [Polyangiales bacterium]